ncbi:Glutathione S-transferase S1 [Dissophora globulifera]|nr:Glutathione S-transferase S1 [Dissophora globulifera]
MSTEPATRAMISYHSADPSLSSFAKSKILEETDIKDLLFTFMYFDIASCGSTSRDMLVYGKAHYGAKYKFESPSEKDWGEGKVPTAFSCLPMLKITAPNGVELDVSESMVIDIYLAERFNLLGDNKFESLTIQSFYANIHYLRERMFSVVTCAPKERLGPRRDNFFQNTLRKFLEDHEYHLKQNGDIGHYVGNRLSLADLHLANVIHYIQTLPWGKMAEKAFRACPSVWKVKENVDKVASLIPWRESDEFKLYEKNSIEWYSSLAVPEDKAEE